METSALFSLIAGIAFSLFGIRSIRAEREEFCIWLDGTEICVLGIITHNLIPDLGFVVRSILETVDISHLVITG